MSQTPLHDASAGAIQEGNVHIIWDLEIRLRQKKRGFVFKHQSERRWVVTDSESSYPITLKNSPPQHASNGHMEIKLHFWSENCCVQPTQLLARCILGDEARLGARWHGHGAYFTSLVSSSWQIAKWLPSPSGWITSDCSACGDGADLCNSDGLAAANTR